MSGLFGLSDEFSEDAVLGKLEGMKDVIEQVNKQFKDPVRPSCFLLDISILSLIQQVNNSNAW